MSDPEKTSQPLSQRDNKRKRSVGEETTSLSTEDEAVRTLPFTPRDESNHASHGTLFDDDPTPRAPVLSNKALSETTYSPIQASDRQLEMLTTSLTSARTTKSQSPTKHIGDFLLSNVQVELKDFGTKGYPVLTAATELYQ